ncbi:MAG TPA: BolA/IbaG family iron-sulfur metabolism protein [Myxococcaceae bacterium]|jgi:acid stress-induced BolA-like protein IbaG/YrbA|nr:BolA/IbaG family iron-sulfur metabolism protein [Myxococcaceae bacterium]HZA52439.1 BolA/IbaG family iron-sulfur metabolism protein [Myxococcaceae bacterium]
MLSAEKLSERIRAALPGAEVKVVDLKGTGDHFEARVVSAAFEGRPMIERHRLVYAPLQEWLDSGELHALTLQTLTPDQWEKLGGSR